MGIDNDTTIVYYSSILVLRSSIMSIEKARLLIRVANQIDDPFDKKALLSMADEILANREGSIISDKQKIEFPIPAFRRYKGHLYRGNLIDRWRIEINGDVFSSPSSAAGHISGHPENGWRMWRYIDESSNSEEPIDRLRHKG